MNAPLPAEITPQAASAQLATLKPDQYVAAVYETFGARIVSALQVASDVDYDVKNPIGMRVAVERRALLRTLRTDLEKTRKEFKAPILEIGKLLDARAKELTSHIEPIEDQHDALIKAEEDRKEQARQAVIAAEAARMQAIQDRIDEISGAVVAVTRNASSSALIAEHIGDIERIEITAVDFGDRVEYAETVRAETLRALADAKAVAEAREEEARKVEADRAELQRLRDEAAQRERDAEARRVADQQKADADAATERAERQRVDQLKAGVANFQKIVTDAIGADSVRLSEIMTGIAEPLAPELWAEFHVEAERARSDAHARLIQMRDAALRNEAQAAELQRIKDADAERERLAREEREQIAAAQKAEQERIDREAQDERDRLQREEDAKATEEARIVAAKKDACLADDAEFVVRTVTGGLTPGRDSTIARLIELAPYFVRLAAQTQE